jgi:DNA-binding NarL/FixJ family response regulator
MPENGLDQPTVALIGFDSGLQAVIEMALEDDGFSVRSFPGSGETAVGDVAAARPDLVILEVGPGSTLVSLVDELRLSETTDAIPVVVLGTLESIVAQAQASGNVYAALREPFDLDDLVRAVRGAIARKPFEARIEQAPLDSTPQFRQAADLLTRVERHMMLDWLHRIRAVEPFVSRMDISSVEFLDWMPRLVNALIVILRHETPRDILAREPDLRSRLREHALLRVRQGIAVEDVVREYQALRDVIGRRLRREMPSESVLPVMEELNYLIDEAIRITVGEHTRLAVAGSADA